MPQTPRITITPSAVLKREVDEASRTCEMRALQAFDGHGCVKLLNVEGDTLKLERLEPGITLKSYWPEQDEEATRIASHLAKELHQAPVPTSLPHMRDELVLLDLPWNIPQDRLQTARLWRDALLATPTQDVLLHGDLHHDNILQKGNDWIAIDPKGRVGEALCEAAAFIRNPIPELIKQNDAATIIQKRIHIWAHITECDPDRLKKWCYVQAVLTWVWALQDNIDYKLFEEMIVLFV